MKYLIIAPTKKFDTQDISGSDVHVTELSKGLGKIEEVTLICKEGAENNQSQVDVLECYETQLPYLNEPLLLLQSLIFSSLTLMFDRDQVIYSRSDINHIYCLAVSKLFRCDYIVEVNGISSEDTAEQDSSGYYYMVKKRLNILSDKLLSHADHVITVTPNIRDTLINQYGVSSSNITVVENGVNQYRFHPMDMKKCRDSLDMEEETIYVGFVGNLRRWHGLESLIHATTHLQSTDEDITIVIVGDGNIRTELEDLSTELGVSDSISFVGRVPYREVPTYINSFDITVAPFNSGRNDMTGVSPLKVYEYLACGKPVVVTDVPNMGFISENELGVVCKKEDPNDLAKSIVTCINDLEKFRGLREYVLKNHSWDSVAAEINSVCNQL